MVLPAPTASCATCGFLGKRDRASGSALCWEAAAADRAIGHLYEAITGTTYGQASTYPWCFRGAADLLREVTEELRLPPNPNLSSLAVDSRSRPATQVVITRPRDCPEWYPWTAGLDPREHFRERTMIRLEEQRRQFEQDMEKDRRAFEERLDTSNQQFQQRLADSDRATRRWGLTLAAIQAVGTVIAIAIAIIVAAQCTPGVVVNVPALQSAVPAVATPVVPPPAALPSAAPSPVSTP